MQMPSDRHGLRLKHVNGQYLKASDIIENIKNMQIHKLDRPPAFIKNFGFENTEIGRLRSQE